jgi:hypothetical protein
MQHQRWGLAPGDEIAPGLTALRLLGVGSGTRPTSASTTTGTAPWW